MGRSEAHTSSLTLPQLLQTQQWPGLAADDYRKGN